MAKAKKIVAPPIPPQVTVELTLSIEEAETLVAITAKIGGDPKLSSRRFTDAVRDALVNAGVNTAHLNVHLNSSSIWIKDDKETI